MKKAAVLFLTILALVCLCSAASADGWVKDGDHLCYYRNNVLMKDTTLVMNGMELEVTEDGWLKGNGEVISINGGYYCIDDEGIMQKDRLIKSAMSPYTTAEEYLFYYGADGKRVYDCWKTVGEAEYYFGDDGAAYTGRHEVEGKYLCIFDDEGKLVSKTVPVQGITLDRAMLELKEGDTARLEATFIPEDAANQNVNWSSDDETIATVDHEGNVTAVSAGSTRIQAVAEENDDYWTECNVTVTENKRRGIETFVKRCYQLILDADADQNNVNKWADMLENGTRTAVEVINDLVNSPLFANRSLSNAETVDVLFRVMLDRPADAGAKSAWADILDQGYSLRDVVSGLSGSVEFSDLCRKYSIVPGTLNSEPADPGPAGPEPSGDDIPDTPRGKIETFVRRCYQLILNRNADPGGLQGWSDALETKASAAANIIDSFVRSDEFVNRNVSDSEAVDILYRTMLDRAADEGGKAGWTDALSKGYTLQHIINGFCASDEFTAICRTFDIEPGSVSAAPVNPQPADDVIPDTPRGKIEAFVKRCYKLILGRDADEGGLQGWSDALESGAGQACQIIDGFVRSPEYVNRNLGNAESVDILYRTMLNRAADEGGKAGWVDALEKGYTLQHIINGFCGSAEFTSICSDFGITAGSLLVQGALVKREAIAPEGEEEAPVVYVNYASEYTNEEKVRAFVEHCYEAVFGREGDAEGVEAWTKLILDGRKTPKKVAYEFIFSDEFQSKLPGNEAFIRILYKLYLNREPNAEELSGWTAMLENGTGLEEIVNGFAGSDEFRAIVKAME